MSAVEGVVTEVLREHRAIFDERGHVNGTVPGRGAWHCWCDLLRDATEDEVVAHVAAAVVQALGLTEEWSRLNVNGYCFGRYDSEAQAQANIDREAAMYPDSKDSRPAHRWVSPWVAVERGEQ